MELNVTKQSVYDADINYSIYTPFKKSGTKAVGESTVSGGGIKLLHSWLCVRSVHLLVTPAGDSLVKLIKEKDSSWCLAKEQGQLVVSWQVLVMLPPTL